MRLRKNIFLLFLTMILILLCCIFYAFQIEPYRIKINHIPFTEASAYGDALKIVQISDLHIKKDFTCQNLKNVVRQMNAQDPDLVIFTGDLYDNYSVYRDDRHIIAELQQIKARYGKIAIWGNRDYGGGAVRQYQKIMESAGFTVLKNEHFILMPENKQILVTGMDDALLGNPGLPNLSEFPNADYRVLLTHEPDTAENYLKQDYDLILSGHSHGGQIDIPFFPSVNERALSVTSLSSKYPGGLYAPDEKNGPALYVNTGIGTTHISARFCVVPEIAVFHIGL